MKSKGFLGTVISFLVLLGMIGAACAPAATPTPKVAPTPTPLPPIKIGMAMPSSGFLAEAGEEAANGFKLYLDKIGYQSAGRSLKLIVEDTASDPATGLTKVRKLVELDKADILFVGYDGEVSASRDYIHAAKIPTLVIAAADAVTQERMSPYIYRAILAIGSIGRVMGAYAYNQMGARTVVITGMDVIELHDMAEGFKEVFTALGGKVVTELYTAPGTIDFLPYFTRIADVKADAHFANYMGAEGGRFVKQYGEVGLQKKWPLLGTASMVLDHMLPAEGEGAFGAVTSAHWFAGLDNPENEEFLRLYRAKHGILPSELAVNGWISAQVLDVALKAVNGNVEDTDAFLSAMKGLKLRTVKGPLSFDKYNNTIINFYITRVDRVGGTLKNVLIETLPNVDQFWMPPGK